jgi:phage terminase large subunit GpA-like protein
VNQTIRKGTPIRLKDEDYRKLRKQILRRDGWRCQLCGSMTNLEIHHKRFRSRSGEDNEHNLITLCHDCHASTHNPHGQQLEPSYAWSSLSWDGTAADGQDRTRRCRPTDLLSVAATSNGPGKFNGLPCEVLQVRRFATPVSAARHVPTKSHENHSAIDNNPEWLGVA